MALKPDTATRLRDGVRETVAQRDLRPETLKSQQVVACPPMVSCARRSPASMKVP
jgi:hypothetical protein